MKKYILIILVFTSLGNVFSQNDKHGTITVKKKTENSDFEIIEAEPFLPSFVDIVPSYPGGEAAMFKFLSENIIYPDSAKNVGVSGKVFVTFIVNSDGTLSDISIQKGIGWGCDEEALRVVKSMPNWAPGTQNGQIVPTRYFLPISFKLN